LAANGIKLWARWFMAIVADLVRGGYRSDAPGKQNSSGQSVLTTAAFQQNAPGTFGTRDAIC